MAVFPNPFFSRSQSMYLNSLPHHIFLCMARLSKKCPHFLQLPFPKFGSNNVKACINVPCRSVYFWPCRSIYFSLRNLRNLENFKSFFCFLVFVFISLFFFFNLYFVLVVFSPLVSFFHYFSKRYFVLMFFNASSFFLCFF